MTRSAIEIIQDATQSTRDALVKPFSQRLDELVAQHPAQVANRASYDRQVANAFVARTTCRIAVKGAPPIPAGTTVLAWVEMVCGQQAILIWHPSNDARILT